MATGRFYIVDQDDTGNLIVELLSQFNNWRDSWTEIHSGRFSSATEGRFDDLLFYDRTAGELEMYRMNGEGQFARLIRRHDVSHDWDRVIPGRFGGPSDYTDLLCYDQSAGVIEFFASDGDGGLESLGRYEDQRTSWDIIVTGQFERYSFEDRWRDLAFYDRDAGYAEFYEVDNPRVGGFRFEPIPGASYDNWRTSWATIVPGVFEYQGDVGRLVTDLLFYDRDAGEGEFYGLFAFEGEPFRWRFQKRYDNWRTSWDAILGGHFYAEAGHGGTDLLFYDRSAGDLQIYNTRITRTDELSIRGVYNHPRWAPGLEKLVAGHWVPTEAPGGHRTGFLTYETGR